MPSAGQRGLVPRLDCPILAHTALAWPARSGIRSNGGSAPTRTVARAPALGAHVSDCQPCTRRHTVPSFPADGCRPEHSVTVDHSLTYAYAYSTALSSYLGRTPHSSFPSLNVQPHNAGTRLCPIQLSASSVVSSGCKPFAFWPWYALTSVATSKL